jgi:hypothetical protein
MDPANHHSSAHIQYNPYQYIPRRDLPAFSCSKPREQEEYVIVDREPGEDCIPRYILRKNAPESEEDSHTVLRVTLFDIEDFVSKNEIQRFENLWFAHGNLDFSSEKAWRKAIKDAKITGAYVFKKSPNVHIAVCQKNRQLEHVVDLSRAKQASPLQRKFSLAGDPASFTRNAGGITQGEDDESSVNQGAESDEVEEYEVSRIIDHKDLLGVLYYSVEWKGYPESDATWLTEEELGNAREAIDEYFKALTAETSESGHNWLGDRVTGAATPISDSDRVSMSRQNSNEI